MTDKKTAAARIVLTVLTVAAIAAIFYNSSLSADESTEQSSPLTMWLNGIFGSLPIPFSVTENFVRKLAHFTEYSILGALMSTTVYLYAQKRLGMLLITIPTGALVAVCDELIQRKSEGRSCQVSDMVLDTCGIIFAALIVTLFITLRQKKKRTENE